MVNCALTKQIKYTIFGLVDRLTDSSKSVTSSEVWLNLSLFMRVVSRGVVVLVDPSAH